MPPAVVMRTRSSVAANDFVPFVNNKPGLSLLNWPFPDHEFPEIKLNTIFPCITLAAAEEYNCHPFVYAADEFAPVVMLVA